jgi:chromosome segregation ATPase
MSSTELHLSDVQQKVSQLIQQHEQLKTKCIELNQHCHLLQQQLYESQVRETTVKKELEKLIAQIASQMISLQENEGSNHGTTSFVN